MMFFYVVSELPFLPFSPHLVTEHWGCSYVLTLNQKHIENILKWAVNLHPIQCILIITESIIFFEKKKVGEGERSNFLSISVNMGIAILFRTDKHTRHWREFFC